MNVPIKTYIRFRNGPSLIASVAPTNKSKPPERTPLPGEIITFPAADKQKTAVDTPKVQEDKEIHGKTIVLEVEEKFPCNACSIFFKNEWELEKHLGVHSLQAQESFRAQRLLKNGTGKQSAKPKCGICRMTFKDTDSILAHIKQEHGGDQQESSFLDSQEEEVIAAITDTAPTAPPPPDPSETQKENSHVLNIKLYMIKCSICKKEVNQSVFLKHYLTHLKTTEGDFQCKACGQSFSGMRALKKHKKEIHNVSCKTFDCNQCLEKFQSALQLKRHMRSFHVELFKSIPKEGIRENGKLKSLENHQREEIHRKKKCKKVESIRNLRQVVVDEISAKRQRIIQEDFSAICPKAEIEVGEEQIIYNEDVLMRSPPQDHQYSLASKVSSSSCDTLTEEETAMTHNHPNYQEKPTSAAWSSYEDIFMSRNQQSIVGLDNNVPFQHNSKMKQPTLPCKLCSHAFYTREELDCHRKTCHNGPFIVLTDLKYQVPTVEFKPNMTGNVITQCQQCSERFDTKEQLDCHTKATHNGLLVAVSANFSCKSCDMTFQYKDNLRHHVENEHSGKNPITCPECGKEFENRPDCLLHMDIHGEKIECSRCRRKLKKNVILRHFKNHDKVKIIPAREQHPCEFCGKIFGGPKLLARHRNKEHKCQMCGKTFKTDEIEAHMTLHHSNLPKFEDPNVCALCEKMFTNPDDLKKHISKHFIHFARN